jgi:cell division transport system permease protein
MAELRTRMQAEVPGALVESHGAWVARLVVLARGVQVAAWLLLAVVAGVAAAVVTVATGAGLAARRESIEIIHGLGATDGYIAGRFARRAMLLAALGALAGAVVALPVLFAFARLATPFITAATGSAAAAAVASPDPVQWLMALPTELLIGLPALPVVAALLGLATAHLTVRLWLRRLP